MAGLMHDIAEAICLVERHEHLRRVHRLGPRPSCGVSRDVAARVIGRIRARERAGGTAQQTAELLAPSPIERDDYGRWLAAEMKAAGLSQRQLADAADVDHATVSRLIRSDRRPLLATAQKLERALTAAQLDGQE